MQSDRTQGGGSHAYRLFRCQFLARDMSAIPTKRAGAGRHARGPIGAIVPNDASRDELAELAIDAVAFRFGKQKEAISAVEGMVATITGEKEPKRALRRMRQDLSLHPAFVDAIEKLYGYTGDEDGIRHGIYDAPNVGFDEAKFMLVTCSALINFEIERTKEI